MTLFCGTCEGGEKVSPAANGREGRGENKNCTENGGWLKLSNSPQVAFNCPTCKSIEIYSNYHYQNWAFWDLYDIGIQRYDGFALHCTTEQIIRVVRRRRS